MKPDSLYSRFGALDSLRYIFRGKKKVLQYRFWIAKKKLWVWMDVPIFGSPK